MNVKPLQLYSNAFAFLRYKFPNIVDQIADIPVVDLAENEWQSNGLNGEGYFIKTEDVKNIQSDIRQGKPCRFISVQ